MSGDSKRWLIGEWDGSQLEFRVAGHLSRDPQILDDVVKGHDVHKFTGVWMHHAPEAWLKNVGAYMGESMKLMPLVTKDQRQDSKPETFKPVYGGTAGNKRQMAYYKAFKERYHVLATTQERWVMEVLQHKQLVTEWGLVYYWPQARMSADGYVNVKSQVYNYPVQALATAEIIPVALAFFRQRIARYGAAITILNTVHDSVVCKVREDHVEAFREAAVAVWGDVYRYLKEVYGIVDFYVPLGAEVAVGTHWGEPQESWKYTVWPDGRVISGA